MADERKYFVLCRDNCKFEGMTKEQIFAAIAEATGNTPTAVDDAFITRLVEQNKNAATRLWVGTETEYNAMVARGEIANDTIYCIKDGDVTMLKNPTSIVSEVYPVGAIYMSVESTSPASLFGGTWERLKDKFLLGAGDTYGAGSTGGSANAVVVAHYHNQIRAYVGNETKPVVSSKSIGGTLILPHINAPSETTTNNNESGTLVTNSVGEDGTGKNMPPYLAVYMWQRTA